MKLLREPLFHFLLLGAALFALFRLVNREEAVRPDDRRIVVTPGQIEHLATTFARTWQRHPTPEELSGLVDHYVREEVLNREAVKLGLDQNDVVIRRRLQQKMEFIAEDFATTAPPAESELQDYLAQHPDTFREETRTTFRQVLFNADRLGDELEREVTRVLAELRTTEEHADTSEFGDPSLLPASFENESQGVIESTFGRDFANQLAELPVGEWSGPVRSGFGVHLVRIEDRALPRVPPLEEIREQVRREWENRRRRESTQQFFETLLQRYQVSVQWPQPEKDLEGAIAKR